MAEFRACRCFADAVASEKQVVPLEPVALVGGAPKAPSPTRPDECFASFQMVTCLADDRLQEIHVRPQVAKRIQRMVPCPPLAQVAKQVAHRITQLQPVLRGLETRGRAPRSPGAVFKDSWPD